jgi:predicted site-specific integrase-resolvase
MILVNVEAHSSPMRIEDVGLYARVSPNDQKVDLSRQAERLSSGPQRLATRWYGIEPDVGLGVEGSRAKVRPLLAVDEDAGVDGDLAGDMVEILTSLCAWRVWAGSAGQRVRRPVAMAVSE